MRSRPAQFNTDHAHGTNTGPAAAVTNTQLDGGDI
jgi:hypothetical protein